MLITSLVVGNAFNKVEYRANRAHKWPDMYRHRGFASLRDKNLQIYSDCLINRALFPRRSCFRSRFGFRFRFWFELSRKLRQQSLTLMTKLVQAWRRWLAHEAEAETKAKKVFSPTGWVNLWLIAHKATGSLLTSLPVTCLRDAFCPIQFSFYAFCAKRVSQLRVVRQRNSFCSCVMIERDRRCENKR